jgi:hypothetical protein
VLEAGPAPLLDLTMRLSPHLNADAFVAVLRESFSRGSGDGHAPSMDHLCVDPQILRLRCFWHDMISNDEQNLLRNAEWAMFYTPTSDFSMALAQWWRLVESILKRVLAGELSDLFAANPDWIQWDRDNLSTNAKKKERLFVEKLADKQKAKKLTLWELLVILEKCLSEDPASGSRLRKEAAAFIGTFRGQVQPLVEQGWVDSKLLSEDNINFFRNQSSHDSPIDALDACVGRLVARRVLELFFLPALAEWGFVPRLGVFG